MEANKLHTYNMFESIVQWTILWPDEPEKSAFASMAVGLGLVALYVLTRILIDHFFKIKK